MRRNLHHGTVYARAWWKRQTQPDITYIGITGSAGKTSTKDLIATILSATGGCTRTEESANEHIHIAKTIARIERRDRFCVVEVSASKPGYLDFPVRLLKPKIGVLTLVARDHYQAFRSVAAIAQEKGKLIARLPADGTAILNMDDALVRAIGERCKCKVIWIGRSEGATIRLVEARSRFPEPLVLKIEYGGESFDVRTRLHGTQLALSVLSALGVAVAAGVSLEDAIAGVERSEAAEGRMQVITEPDGVTFVRDDWKAPYWSLSAALHFMREARATRKVVVIGTLSDYSDKATKLYPKVARLAREVADYVVFVGPHALRGAKARRSDDDDTIVGFPNIRDAVRHLQSFLRAGDVVLLKGSNKADHLVRIILNRTRPVQCWRDRCGLPRFCRRCDHLFQPMGDGVKGIREMSATVLTYESSCSDSARFVIVGLGNPGDRNNRTPHNVGYRAVDALAVAGGATWEEQVEGWTSVVEIDGTLIRLLKPRTNMNESGPAVQQFLQRLGTDPSKCVIVHDDNDLALGDVRVKSEGGDAGHKGVRSVISALGTGNIARIRIGVRRDGDVRKARDVVLSEFSPTDEVSLAPAISKAANSAMASMLPATTEH